MRERIAKYLEGGVVLEKESDVFLIQRVEIAVECVVDRGRKRQSEEPCSHPCGHIDRCTPYDSIRYTESEGGGGNVSRPWVIDLDSGRQP